jgi:hypothetical protein
MALIECPECKGQVSDTVRHCPHCGFHVKKCCRHHHGRPPLFPLLVVGAAVVVFLILFCAMTVNVNSNNGMINLHWNRLGIFPRIKFNCWCGKGK